MAGKKACGRRSRRLSAAMAVVGLALVPATGLAVTINVPADHPTIQAAVNAAADGDTVLVAPGTYDGQVSIVGKSITLTSSGGAEVTTIRGATPAVAFNLAAPATTEIVTFSGFTVTKPAAGDGGGIESKGVDGVIERNRIVAGSTCNNGGVNLYQSDITVRHNVVASTTASGCSGNPGIMAGISNSTVEANLIVDNANGGFRGNNFTGVVRGNLVVGNDDFNNSGIEGVNTPSADGYEIIGNLVAWNRATNGAAVHILQSDTAAPVTLEGNTIVANSGSGAATAGRQLSLDTFAGRIVNMVDNVISGADGPLVSCSGAGALWTANTVASTDGGTRFVACVDPTGTAGNLGVLPTFVDAAGGDFHLTTGSMLVDAGAGVGGTDVDGDTRPVDGNSDGSAFADIGFDEAGDAADPQTTLTSATGTGKDSTSATFAFESSTLGASFQCDVDMQGWAPCASPVTVSTVDKHHHSFRVRAHAGLDRDRSPAMRIWSNEACTIVGSEADDTLIGTAGDDDICALGGDDDVAGAAGDDHLAGGDGRDLLSGGFGADVLLGGLDLDVADYTTRLTAVHVDLSSATPSGNADDGAGDTLDGLEIVWAGAGNDELLGGPSANAFSGGPGADVIRGGPGFDTVDYSDIDVPVAVDLDGAVGDDGAAGEGDSVGADVEDIFGGSAGDTLIGNDARNVIDGSAGDDRIITRDFSADRVVCGLGKDTAEVDPSDAVDSSCEVVQVDTAKAPPSVWSITRLPFLAVASVRANASAGVDARLACQDGPCSGRILLTTIRTVNGRPTAVVVGGRLLRGVTGTKLYRVPLNATGRRLVQRSGRLSVRVRIDTSGSRTSQLKTVVVRRPTSRTTNSLQEVSPRRLPALRSVTRLTRAD